MAMVVVEAEAVAAEECILEMGHLVIYLHGKGLVGYMAPDHAGISALELATQEHLYPLLIMLKPSSVRRTYSKHSLLPYQRPLNKSILD